MKSSREWAAHFEGNAASLIAIPWADGPELAPGERRAVAGSIRVFQLGESSEGRHLIECARRHAQAAGDPAYLDAARLFIKEEQRHAATLGRFLDQEGIPRLRRAFTDSVFRRLRRPAGLEVSIAVLLTAEIIALVYYQALQAATESPTLRAICDQILLDEEAHVRFQAERLGLLRRRRSRIGRAITNALQRALFFGACLVVWGGHRPVFKAGDFSARRYWRACWDEFGAAFALAVGGAARGSRPADQPSAFRRV